MKYTTLAIALSLASSFAAAQVNPQDHEAHHPEGAASAPSPSARPAKPSTATPEKFGQQMQMMQEMHRRMQAAKTPAEKQALMAEHMKVMQSGMDMMSQMGQGMVGMDATAGMGGMGGMMGMHGAMERRMAMMEQMMQMMVDREAATQRR